MPSTSYGQTVWNVAEYDAPRRRLVPSFDLLYTAAAEAVARAVAQQTSPLVLDLGAGTGLLSAAVIAHVPGARLHLLDGSPEMLQGSHRRFENRPGTQFTVADLTAPLPGGPFAAVVSALAIHHLNEESKRALYAHAFTALQPGGVLVNLDQVLAPTPALERVYAAAHEACARRNGSTDAEWSAAEDRMKIDRPSTLDDQLHWLCSIGFVDVDCLVKDYRMAVIVGRKPTD